MLASTHRWPNWDGDNCFGSCSSGLSDSHHSRPHCQFDTSCCCCIRSSSSRNCFCLHVADCSGCYFVWHRSRNVERTTRIHKFLKKMELCEHFLNSHYFGQDWCCKDVQTCAKMCRYVQRCAGHVQRCAAHVQGCADLCKDVQTCAKMCRYVQPMCRDVQLMHSLFRAVL